MTEVAARLGDDPIVEPGGELPAEETRAVEEVLVLDFAGQY